MNKKINAMFLILVFAFSLIPISASAGNGNSDSTSNIRNYTKIKSDSTGLGNAWNNAKTEWNRIKTSSGTGNKFGAETDDNTRLEKYKEFLSLTIDRIINRLDLLSFWVEEKIEDKALAEDLLNKIEGHRDGFKDLKESVENAQSIDELKELAKKIKEKWVDANHDIRRAIGHILGTRYGGMIERLELVSDKLHAKIDALDQNNKLVSQMQDLLSTIDEKIVLAKDEYKKYNEQFMSSTSNGSDDNIIQSREHLRNVHRYLKEIHDLLKELIKLYRDYQNLLTPETNSKPLYLDMEEDNAN